MVVHGVKRSRGRRRHPGGIRAGLGVGDFRLDHFAHLIRHRPHSFADLRLARQSGFDADVHVPVFVSFDPRLRFDLFLGEHRAQFHARVNLVAGPIQEARVDKYHPLLCRADAFLEIDRGAALFVHDADFESVTLQVKSVFYALEQLDRGRCFFGPMEFGLDDVDAAGFAVAHISASFQVMDRGQCRDHSVEKAFRYLSAVSRGDGIGIHMDTHVPDEQETSPRKYQLSSGRRDKGFVRVEPSMQRSTAFVESRFEGPFHDAAPASIDPDLVGRVDGGHGVFTVLDRRYRRFHDHVFHARRVRLADGMAAIDLNLDARSVIA